MNMKKMMSKAQPPPNSSICQTLEQKKPLKSYSNLQTATFSHTAHFTKPLENTNKVKYSDIKLPFSYRSDIKHQITFCSSEQQQRKKVCKNRTKVRKSSSQQLYETSP